MDLKRTWSEWSKVQRGIAIGVAALVVALIAVFAFLKLHRSRNLANTMRLIRKEGFVFLEENNELKTVTNNMRFQSGDVLTTGKQSLASISLDDTKIITMEEESTVDFTKSGKQLELKLRSGKIYFEVNKPLEDDESMYIKTSNVIVGVRGTAGWVFYDREGHQCVLLTSGKVTISATNPWTGETKSTTVEAGQLLITYLYSDRTTDSVMFELMEATSIPEDMDPSGMETIASDVSETTLETQESTSATTTTKAPSQTSQPDEGGNTPSGTPRHPPTMTPVPGSGGAKNTPTPTPSSKGSGSGSKNTPTPSARPTPSPTPNGNEDETKETEGTTESSGTTEPKESSSSSSSNGGTSSSSSESSKQSSSESSKTETAAPDEGGNGGDNGSGDNGGGNGGEEEKKNDDNGGGNNGETEGNGGEGGDDDEPLNGDYSPYDPGMIVGDGQVIG